MTKTKKADQAREARYVEPGGSRLGADASEQRLALMRPLSLATIFAAVSGSASGFLHGFRSMGMRPTPEWSGAVAMGFAESLVPVFVGFGCLTVAWLCVAVGLHRRP